MDSDLSSGPIALSSVWTTGASSWILLIQYIVFVSPLATIGAGGSILVNTVRRDSERAKKILCYTAVSSMWITNNTFFSWIIVILWCGKVEPKWGRLWRNSSVLHVDGMAMFLVVRTHLQGIIYVCNYVPCVFELKPWLNIIKHFKWTWCIKHGWIIIFIICPVQPRAHFHCKTIEKIPVWGRKKPSGPARIAYGPHTGILSIQSGQTANDSS